MDRIGKHTQGEWSYSNAISNECYYIQTTDKTHRNSFIGEIGGGLQLSSEIKANAKLIANAPNMLNTLQYIVDYYENPQESRSMIQHLETMVEKAKEAIKKATE